MNTSKNDYKSLSSCPLFQGKDHFYSATLVQFYSALDNDIVLFRNLSREQIKEIVEVQLTDLRKRLAEKRMTLHLSDAVKGVLAEKGYDPVFGARPLKRAVQKYLQDPISMKILEEGFVDEDDISVETNGTSDKFIFKKSSSNRIELKEG